MPAAPYQLLAIDRQITLSNKLEPDLLAMDATGTPWIFEFKRDIAEPEAISQILVYAANVLTQDMDFFKTHYSKRDKRRDLAEAFKTHFKVPLPRDPSKMIRLVIAAYDFSVYCRQAMDLLAHSTGVTIGRLSIKCVHAAVDKAQTRYDWIVHPTAFSLPKFPTPSVHHWVSLDARLMGVTWGECLSYEFLPANGLKSSAPVMPGQGVFVYLRNLEPNPLDCSDGMVGMGVVDGPAFDLHDHEDQFKLSVASFAQLNKLPQPFMVLPVRWMHRRPEGRQCSILKDYCEAKQEKVLAKKIETQAFVERAIKAFID